MQGQNHAGFSNPFGEPQNPNMNQGYNGFQPFIPPSTGPNPQSQINPKASIHKSKIEASTEKDPQKRKFKGKYELDATIPVKYNTVDYFMLVENVRINNETALREIKRGKSSDILEKILDSLEFLSYVQK